MDTKGKTVKHNLSAGPHFDSLPDRCNGKSMRSHRGDGHDQSGYGEIPVWDAVSP